MLSPKPLNTPIQKEIPSETRQKKEYYNHPLLKHDLIQFRDYQVSMAQKATDRNTLIVLPTALGKTIIALISIANVLQKAPNSRILVLSPTRPLVVQHFNSFQKFFVPNIKCCLFSSNLSPLKRAMALNENHILFSTPQIIQNDLASGLYTLEGFGQIIFDETHKARKRYAYTSVARNYLEQCCHPLILGLTASPGKDLYRINELCQTLQIEEIVFRDYESKDVQQYIHPTESIYRNITLPEEITKAKLILDTALREIQSYLLSHEILPKRNYVSKFQFIQLIQDLKNLDILLDPHLTESDKERYHVSVEMLNFPHLFGVIGDPNRKIDQAAIMNRAITGIYLCHLQEILTTEHVELFRKYLAKLQQRAQEGNFRVKRLLQSKYIQGIIKLLKPIQTSPKVAELQAIITTEFSQNPSCKIIIFTQYRQMGSILRQRLNKFRIAPKELIMSENKEIARRFVGQASHIEDAGLSQKEQSQMIQDFEQGEFNILIATSVAEEGLDIPNVDAVIFYDSVPSEIRLIQRRGRTGRHSTGHCYFLITNNTLDQIYNQVSHRRESKMKELLQDPNAVEIVEDLPRSKASPNYKNQSIPQLEEKIHEIKLKKQEKQQLKIQQLMEEHEKSNTPRFKGSSTMNLVQDYTSILTKQTIHNPHRQYTTPIQNKDPNLQFMTQKIFYWIISTMETFGDQKGNMQYCDLDLIYQAAKDEGMNIAKIDSEIEKGMKYKFFQTRKNWLILISQGI